VKNIEGYPNYKTVKTKLLSGHFKENKNHSEETIDGASIKGQVFLTVRDKKEPDCDWVLDGCNYKVSEPYPIEGEWTILFYLYEVFDLEGFADINVDGKYYALKTEVINNIKEDLIVAKSTNGIVIGRR
jgi:hypothetical protein